MRVNTLWYQDVRLEPVGEAHGPSGLAVPFLLASLARQRGLSAGAKLTTRELASIARIEPEETKSIVGSAIETGLLRPLRYHGGDLIHVAVDLCRTHRSAISPVQRDRIITRDRRICGICGLSVGLDEKLEIDHVRPVSKDGSDHDSNLQVAHFSCNRAKAARW